MGRPKAATLPHYEQMQKSSCGLSRSSLLISLAADRRLGLRMPYLAQLLSSSESMDTNSLPSLELGLLRVSKHRRYCESGNGGNKL